LIQLDNTILSDDLFTTDFVCNLKKCKGICCVEGDSGAPLEKDELAILEDIYDKIKPFLTQKGIEAIENEHAGQKYVIDEDGDYVTPLVKGQECAYVVFEENGCTKCGIEKAFEAGVINYQKPISCHLYPIRIQEYKTFTAVNYNEWFICSDACSLGKELKVNVIDFLKEPLIRKFGQDWYEKVKEIKKDSF